MKKAVLILGSYGMLGQELVRAFSDDEKYTVTAWDADDIDVTDSDTLKARIDTLWPDIIINAVAYNAVDLCEESLEEKEKAIALNVTYPKKLAQIAKTLNAVLVHYSTDYVFDGKRPQTITGERADGCCGAECNGCQYEGPEDSLVSFMYAEDDKPHPLSVYAQSKYDGELEVAQHGPQEFYIIRLSKLFGKPATSAVGKKSFFEVMLAKGKSEDEVMAVDGELSKFTYAPDLALESKKIIEDNNLPGIYHVVNDGAATWYDGVKALYNLAGISTPVKGVSPETFPRPAVRPACSVLEVTKRTPLRHYEEALAEYLGELNQ